MMEAYSAVDHFTGPFHGSKITSPFGPRIHPITGKQSHHNGIDFGGVPRGHVWTSPFPGVVTYLGNGSARGKYAVVRIQDTKILQIMQHLDGHKRKVGENVVQGSPIGTNGMTGDVTGPHLHYELRVDDGTPLGAPVWGDPAQYKRNLEEEEMPVDVILLNTQFDAQAGFWLQPATGAGIYIRGKAANAVLPNAKTVYVVGGDLKSVTTMAPNAEVINLSGSNQKTTMQAVLDYLAIAT